MESTQLTPSSQMRAAWFEGTGIEIDAEYQAKWDDLVARAFSAIGVFGSLENEDDILAEDLLILEDDSLQVSYFTSSDRALIMDVPPGHWAERPDGVVLDAEYEARWRALCLDAALPGGVLWGISPDQIADEMVSIGDDGSLVWYSSVTGPGDISLVIPAGHWSRAG